MFHRLLQGKRSRRITCDLMTGVGLSMAGSFLSGRFFSPGRCRSRGEVRKGRSPHLDKSYAYEQTSRAV